MGGRVYDGSLVATAVQWEHTVVRGSVLHLKDFGDSRRAGEALGDSLDKKGLGHVFLLADGLLTDAALVRGLRDKLPPPVGLSGGLAGDGEHFQETLAFMDNMPTPGQIVALGFYGSRFKAGCAAFGGWEPFGPERIITRADGRRLLSLDGETAWSVYKRYLGDETTNGPLGAAFLPLLLSSENGSPAGVCVPRGVDARNEAILYSHEMPEKQRVRFLRPDLERMAQNAGAAAKAARSSLSAPAPILALVMSDAARRSVLGQRVEEELESVQEALGGAFLAGFYGCGQIAPVPGFSAALLANALSVTVFGEQ